MTAASSRGITPETWLTPVVAVVLGAAIIRFMPAVLQHLGGGLGEKAVETGITIALFGSLMLVATIAGRVQKLPVWRLGAQPGSRAALSLPLGIAALLATTGIAALSGTVVAGGAAPGRGAGILLGTLLLFVQTAGEEVYVRGWLQPILGRALGGLVAVAVAAAVFMVLHLIIGARAPLTLLNLFLAGTWFGLLALRTGGLAAPIAAHFGWNWAEGVLLGLDPNPGVSMFGALFNLDMRGSAAWGGSPEGLNASLATAFVLVALILPLLVRRAAVASPVAPLPAVPTAESPVKAPNRNAFFVGEDG
jgi:membrane protease YdiL (CAAX protease family)